MKLVDTHVHLNFDQFDGDRDQVLARATDAGVTKFINVGTGLDASERSVELAENHENIWAAVGVHPSEAGELVDADLGRDADALARLRKLVHHKRTVAVGEIGFDFFRSSNPSRHQQGEAFFAQAELAQEADLPIIVHFREGKDADDNGYGFGCLKEYADTLLADDPLRRWPGVVHCYTGGVEMAQEILKAGYVISFTAPVTYPKNEELREVVRAVPLEKIMVETDCPFLPPPDKRGERNEPAYVVEIARKIAELRGISLDEVAAATTRNAERLFGLT